MEAHRQGVREAILGTAAALVADHGLRGVTMSQIAEETGIGRATLYKYFSGVEAILFAWHERQIGGHLAQLAEARDGVGNPTERLRTVLETYALVARESHGPHNAELAAFLHRDARVAGAERRVRQMVRDLIVEGAQSGGLRSDISPDELTAYCLHALTAAPSLPSNAAVRRLVAVTLDGLSTRSGQLHSGPAGMPAQPT